MKKLNKVKAININLDKESAEATEKLMERGFKIASVVRALLKKYGNDYQGE